MPRFFVPDPPREHAIFILPEASAHHAARVLRLAVGDALVLFDGSGCEWPVQIARIDRHGVVVQVGEGLQVQRESPLKVTLIQGISSGERMDFTLQKAVELGVSHIQPVSTVRSVVRLSGERALKRQQHWQQLVIAACEQCGRNVIPEVAAVMPLVDVLGQALAGLRLLLDPLGALSLHELDVPDQPVRLLAGPEGGFDPAERALALQNGFIGVRLGPRVLRTETAALAAISAMQVLWGDF